MPSCQIFWKSLRKIQHYSYLTPIAFTREIPGFFLQWKVFNYWWGLITEGQLSLPILSWFSHYRLNVPNTAPVPSGFLVVGEQLFVVFHHHALHFCVIHCDVLFYLLYVFVSSFLFSHLSKVKFVIFSFEEHLSV